jgi:hypothetical protein
MDVAPSEGWTAPDRPELSPEHVALLTWWADMIAKGQFPGPVPGQAPPDSDPTVTAAPQRRTSPRSSSRGWLVGLGLGGVVVAGLAVAFGPAIVSAFADEPAPVPATELVMPAAVGEDLVAVTGPEVDAQMQALVGVGLRPAGVTVSAAYGTDPAGPLVVAAVATTVPVPGDATAELTTWAESSGVPIGEPVPGTGATTGITCAEVTDTETAPPGSKCIWTGTGMNGRTYVVASDPAAALERTAEVRSGIAAPSAS